MEITKELIEDAVSDLSIGGKYSNLYTMLVEEVDNQISDIKIKSIIETLEYIGVYCQNMSKLEILFEYSKLI